MWAMRERPFACRNAVVSYHGPNVHMLISLALHVVKSIMTWPPCTSTCTIDAPRIIIGAQLPLSSKTCFSSHATDALPPELTPNCIFHWTLTSHDAPF
jgi:hypothetical protein